MNAIHTAILDFLRHTEDAKLTSLMALADNQIVHRMFANQRGRRGVRLTQFGLQIMQGYFETYEIKVPEDEEVLTPSHLMFLDERSILPYYCDAERIIVFDAELGVKLRLIDGRLSVLANIESD